MYTIDGEVETLEFEMGQLRFAIYMREVIGKSAAGARRINGYFNKRIKCA